MAIGLRHVFLSALAATTVGFTFAPGAPGPSEQRYGTAEAISASNRSLTAEGRTLEGEYNATVQLENQIIQAQASLNQTGAAGRARVAELQAQRQALETRISQRNGRVAAFHQRLLLNPNLSEADMGRIYTDAFKGTQRIDYYTENVSYRDECRVQLGAAANNAGNLDTCMQTMEDGEFNTRLPAVAKTSGIAFGGTLVVVFGLGAIGGANRRRLQVKQQKNNRALLDSTKDLLRPSNRS